MALTDCRVCSEVSDETLADHLATRHPNEFLHIENDPESGESLIIGRSDLLLGVMTLPASDE